MVLQVVLIACVLSSWGVKVSSQVVTPATLTRLSGSTAQFQASVQINTSLTTPIFSWIVNDVIVSTVRVQNSTSSEVNTTSSGHNVTAATGQSSINMTLQFLNVSSSPSPATIQLNQSQSLIGNSTLIVRDDCGTPPSGIILSCPQYPCTANSSTFSGRPNNSSMILYSCWNTSTCSSSSEWSPPEMRCNEASAVGCVEPGKWAPNCSESCAVGCQDQQRCGFADGACTCRDGFSGSRCNVTSSCSSGKWGPLCNNSCSIGCPDTSCNRTTGVCTNSTTGAEINNCRPGFNGSSCNQTIACPNGKWGPTCNANCGTGCLDTTCNRGTGVCTNSTTGTDLNGCKAGYNGSLCNQTTNCSPGKWGDTCNKNCGQGCLDTTCTRTTGVCTNSTTGAELSQCRVGYVGQNCSERGCQFGTWGPGCTKTCGDGCPNFGKCNIDNSNCAINELCKTGYNPPNCSTAICDNGCNGGECVAPNICQLCPIHFESGSTCRNIRLDGFLKGSLSTFAILTAVVVLLSLGSSWYLERKVQQNKN